MILRNSSMREFCNQLENKHLVCFGASYMLEDMCNLYEELNIIEHIDVIADNDKAKQNTELIIKGRKVQIISVIDLKKTVTQNTVILITTEYFDAIIEQLDRLHEFDEIPCYIYPIMHYTKRVVEEIPYNNNEIIIPKKIHYCWFGRNPIPEFEKKCIDSWRRWCPEYEIIEWNEENYDVWKNQYISQAYKEGQYAFVSDYARLDIIYRFGGLYFDTDVELLKKPDDLLRNKAFAAFQHNSRVATGLGMGAVSENVVIKEMRDYYHDLSFIKEDGLLNRTACTVYQTDVLRKYGFKENGHYQVINEMAVYPQDYFQPKCPITGISNIVEQTYAIHHSRESWASNAVALRRRETHGKMSSILYRINKAD